MTTADPISVSQPLTIICARLDRRRPETEGHAQGDESGAGANKIIKEKLLDSDELVTPAAKNMMARSHNSSTLAAEIMNPIIDALAAHTTMSKQALEQNAYARG